MTDRATPLLAAHQSLGARLTEFAGWQMPLQYSGVIAEHNAVRTSAGLFDVTHLGKLRMKGPDAGEALQRAVTADVVGLEPGRARYALALVDDGGCIDDVFVYRIAADEWLVVPNAANVEAVAGSIRECGGEPVDEWDRYAILALQGPDSFTVFEKVWPGSEALTLKLHRWSSLDVFGHEGIVARTGYTGERGFEIYAPFEVAERAWTALLDAGASPVGLGARDTLRLEMGYALYGHELSLDVNPLEAGLGWAIAWDSPFRGREALLEVKERGPARRLFGIVCSGKGVPRQGYEVFGGDPETKLGELTSGNFSPTLGTGIALALGPAETRPEPGETVAIEARGRRIPGDIVKPPFKKS
ncbi:MAG TPA: glycine cleavage system aminomethyltransferase GcvT [Actinomycetota bacterium]|nr:glycine cleavage system aminomethyltransferase GcvT [Actinomycetota bacterium]